MSTGIDSAAATTVTLIRHGQGKVEVSVPSGATVADLLHAAHASAGDHDIYIDGRALAECLVLKQGVIVSLVPRSPREAAKPTQRSPVGVFRYDPEFDAMIEQVDSEREAEKDRS